MLVRNSIAIYVSYKKRDGERGGEERKIIDNTRKLKLNSAFQLKSDVF